MHPQTLISAGQSSSLEDCWKNLDIMLMLTGVMSGVTLVEQRIRLSMGLPNQTEQAHGPASMEGIAKPLRSRNDSGFQSNGAEILCKRFWASQSLPFSIEFGRAGS